MSVVPCVRAHTHTLELGIKLFAELQCSSKWKMMWDIVPSVFLLSFDGDLLSAILLDHCYMYVFNCQSVFSEC